MFFNPCRVVPGICQASVTGNNRWEWGGPGCCFLGERGDMGWGVGGFIPDLERGIPFHPIPFPVSPMKGGQRCSCGSREEHPCAMGSSQVPPELPLRRIPEQEWGGWEQRWAQLFSWGSITQWEVGMWLS